MTSKHGCPVCGERRLNSNFDGTITFYCGSVVEVLTDVVVRRCDVV